MTMLGIEMMLRRRGLQPAFRNLAALFNSGAVDGVMIDLTDKTTLFQDANGILPVAANADPVGLALDQHKWGGLTLAAYRAFQTEIVTNGDFAVDIANWAHINLSNGVLSWQSPGKIRLTANNSNTPGVNQAIICVVGRWYELTVQVVTGNAAFTSYGIGAVATSANTYSSGNIGNAPGTYRRFFKATATTHYVILYGPNSSGQFAEFDNISVKEIDGHHATAAGGNRPTWASATNDVLFDGSNDYLSVGDFDFPAGDCFTAAWAKSTLANRAIAGVTETNRMVLVHQTSGNFPTATVGTAPVMVGVTAINNVYTTIHADKNTANANLIVNGVVEGTKATPGTTATVNDMIIGGQNSGGTPGAFMAGNIKRIVAGQVRAQDTMTAADFHANLIAA